MHRNVPDLSRTRWAAIGSAVAVALGAGGLLPASASIGSGERAVYVPIAPCRVMDTRPAPDTVGARSAPLGPGDTHTIGVRGTNGNCTVPADAVGLVMNVAIIAPTTGSFLTVFAADVPRPLAANLNWVALDPPLSNAVTTDISADGRVSFYNLAGSVHVAADIVGFYVDHHHDDRYYTEAEADARLAAKANSADVYTKPEADARLSGLTGANIVDGSLRLSDLGGRASIDTPVGTAITLQPGDCKAQLTGNFGDSVVGHMVVGTLTGPDGEAVLPNSAAMIPSIVIRTTQGGAVPNLVVCNTGGSVLTIPAGSVFHWRLIAT